MKFYDVMKCKRMALGWSQKDLAEQVGVSSATISTFERGEPVSHLIENAIKRTIDDTIAALPWEKRSEVNLVSQSLGLAYQTPREKLASAMYINLAATHLGIELNKQLREEAP